MDLVPGEKNGVDLATKKVPDAADFKEKGGMGTIPVRERGSQPHDREAGWGLGEQESMEMADRRKLRLSHIKEGEQEEEIRNMNKGHINSSKAAARPVCIG
jgi:hypothetical protein